MPTRKDKLFLMKGIFAVVYSIIILSVAVYSLKKPEYNWDILPYMGVILLYDHVDVRTMHQDVYHIAKEQLSPVLYNRFVDPANKYRSVVAQNPDAFYQQLPFYVVKPLYTCIAYLLYKAGVSLPMSTVFPSAISYFLIGLLLFYWIQNYRPVIFSFVASLLIMFSAPLLSVAKLSTPDAISGLLLFSAVFCIIEKKSLAGTFIFLLLAVTARIDNIIPAVFFLTVMNFSDKWNGKINFKKYVYLILALSLTCFSISFNAHSFGWSVFYYPDFIKQLNSAYEGKDAFAFTDYIALVKAQLMTGLYFSFISLFLLLVLFLFPNTHSFKLNELNIEQIFALLFLLLMFTRFVLQPLIADRLYIPYYLSLSVFLLKRYSFVTNGQFYTR